MVIEKLDAPLALEAAEGIRGVIYQKYADGEWSEQTSAVPVEIPLTIYVNGRELVTILCTSIKLNCLVVGFLYNEGLISSLKEVLSLRVCQEDSLAEIRLNKEIKSPTRRALTSGCGGGSLFRDTENAEAKVNSSLLVSPQEVLSLMRQLQEAAVLYRQYGGLHTAALADTRNLLVTAEDIGRHNTLDKIAGECLLRDIATQDRLLLTTGRLSSEMLFKARRMSIPVVVSRGAPTDRALALAQESDITLIGYARARRLSAYTHQWRLKRKIESEDSL